MKTRADLERERSQAAGTKERSLIGVGGAILIIVGAIAIWLFVTTTPDEPKKVAASPVGGRDSVQCDRLVQLFRRDGIVKGERMGGRITVDEKRWSQTSEDNRRGLIAYVSCAAFNGRGPDELDTGAAVTIHGAASGKLLARASRDGVELSPAR